MKPFQEAKLDLPPVKDFINNTVLAYGVSRSEAKAQYNRLKTDLVYLNDQYQVNVDANPPNGYHPNLVHLSIKRIDKDVIHDWRDLQQIKNMLMGDEAEAVELYPAESRLVDSANQFHLFVIPPGQKFPFGFNQRGVDYESKGGAVQRPLAPPGSKG